MNVVFEYMYRDAGNYKLYNSIIMSNNQDLSEADLELHIRKSLIDSEYFIPDKCNIPKMEFPDYDSDLDHDWHEFVSIQSTDEKANSELDVLDFIRLSTITHKKTFP